MGQVHLNFWVTGHTSGVSFRLFCKFEEPYC
jgi:hypothetical protein